MHSSCALLLRVFSQKDPIATRGENLKNQKKAGDFTT